jgi:hypothetical protein
LFADLTHVDALSQRFPHGMKWLGDYIHNKSLLFGIYTDIAPVTCGGYAGSGGNFDLDAQTFAVFHTLHLTIISYAERGSMSLWIRFVIVMGGRLVKGRWM